MSYLEINNLCKSFNNEIILNDINIKLDKGEVLSIVGNSGSGKTTLLRILNNLEKSDCGEVIIDTKKTTYKEYAKEFGLVFQNYNLFPEYNLKNNITLALNSKSKKDINRESKNISIFKRFLYKRRKYKDIKIENENIAVKLLNEMELGQKASSYPYLLSGGEKQRACIARALALDPSIICFDEPTSALNPRLKDEVSKAILRLKTLGKTVIVVTHEMELAKKISDKVAFIDKGIIKEYGDSSILTKPSSKELEKFLVY